MIRFFLVILICTLSELSFAQPYESVHNDAFRRGEKLSYNVYYKSFITGKLLAGEATLEIKNDNRQFNGRDTYHIECIGKTRHAFNWFMKVNEHFESYIDEKAIFPWLFIRQTREGRYSKDDEVEFNPKSNMAKSHYAKKLTPPKVQDILSAFYFARTKNISKMVPGDNFSIPIFLDDSVYVSAVICRDREVVKTTMGNFNCVKFSPMVVTGKVFSDRYPMTLWITDDKNKIPILVESTIFLGKVRIELTESSGLANPMTSKTDSLQKNNSSP
jgi:hypothetical protein